MQRLVEFYATLDIMGEKIEQPEEYKFPNFLKDVFDGEDNFWKAVEKLQNLKEHYNSEDKLIKMIAELIRQDPRNFLIL